MQTIVDEERKIFNGFMECPACRRTLVKVGMGKYETLVEHVCDPNGDVPERPTYGCPNKDCFLNRWKTIWTFDGEHLGDNHLMLAPYELTYRLNEFKSINFFDNPHAVNTIVRNVEYQKERTSWRLKIWWLCIRAVYKKKYLGERELTNVWTRNRKIEIYWKNILYISGIHMFFFLMDEYFRYLEKWIRVTDDEDSEGLRRKIHSLAYRYEDKRWWSRLASFLIRKIMPYGLQK